MKNETISFTPIAANAPTRKPWITPEIQDAPVVGTTAKTADEIEAGATFKLGS